MFKKLFLIGIFCIGLVGLFGTQATAYPPDSSDTNVCPWCTCPPLPTVYCGIASTATLRFAASSGGFPFPDPLTTPVMVLDTKIVGIGSLSVPSEAWWRISIEKMTFFVVNPGGNSNPWANGIPWQGKVSIGGVSVPGSNGYIDKRGSWHQIIPIFTRDIEPYIEDWPELPNDEWHVLAVIDDALLELTGTSNYNEQCEDYDNPQPPPADWEHQCYPQIGGGGEPPFPPNPNPILEEVFKGYVRFGTNYDDEGVPLLGEWGWATELFHWDIGNNDLSCVYPNPDGKKADPPEYDCEYFFPPYELCGDEPNQYLDYWWNTKPDDCIQPE